MNKKLGLVIGIAACAALLAAPSGVLAQTSDDGRPIAQEETFSGGEVPWGLTTTSIYNVAADDFSVRLLGWANAQLFNNAEILPAANGTLDISGPIHLPAGALITSLQVFYQDTDAASNPSGQFFRTSTTGLLTNVGSFTFPAFSGGDNNVTLTLPSPGHTVDNLTNQYSVNFSLPRTATGLNGIYRVRVNYRLQVSPGPAIATFADVPITDGRFRFVEALVASGLTGGCGGGNFCPDAAVTRGQLAVFLAGALGMHFPN